MDLFDVLETDFRYEDEDGSLVQLVHDGYQQVNILKSKKGSTRGKHFHKISAEAFYVVSGCVSLVLRNREVEQKKIFREGDFFRIPAFTWHFMEFPDDCIMVALYDVGIEKEDGTKDIYREGE